MTSPVAIIGLRNEQFTAGLGQALSGGSDEIIASPDNVSLTTLSSEPLIVSYGMQMPAFVHVVKKDPFGLRSRNIPEINEALDKLEIAFENYDPNMGVNLEGIDLTCFNGFKVCDGRQSLNLEKLLQQLTDKTQYPLHRANLPYYMGPSLALSLRLAGCGVNNEHPSIIIISNILTVQ